MQVRETLLALYELQKIDHRALELERAAEQIPKKITELEGKNETYRVELGTLNTEADALRREQRDAEALIRDDKYKLEKWRRRANDIKVPREYAAMSREIDQAERHVRELEDRVLAIMAELEQRDGALREKAEALKTLDGSISEEVRALRATQMKLRGEALEITAGRAEAIAKLDEKTAKLYEYVRKRRGGVAVAVTSGSTCTGCNVEIRPQQMVEIRRFDQLHQCPQCQRIVVLDALVQGSGG